MSAAPHLLEVDSRYSWFRLAVGILLGTIGSVGMWAVVVVLPAVQAEFGVARADASIPYTATMIGFAAGNALLGRLVDRRGIMLPVIGASLALALGFVGASVSGGIWQFALCHLLIGLGSSATFGPLIADISHWFLARRGLAVAAGATGNYLSGAIWPVAMQWPMEAYGWRVTLACIALVCAVGMLPLTWFLRHRAPLVAAGGATRLGASRRTALSPSTLQVLLILAGLSCCLAMSMPQVHIVAYCADLGYGVARGAEMLSLMLAGGIVSRLASGFVADRIGGVKTLLIGSVGQGLALLFYIPFDGLASLYVVSLIFGLSQGGIVPCYAIIVREYMPAAEAGARVGVVIMATIVGMAIGGWMSGYIYDVTGSYALAFLNGIAWNVVNVAVMLVILWRGGPRVSPSAA